MKEKGEQTDAKEVWIKRIYFKGVKILVALECEFIGACASKGFKVLF